MSRIEVHLAGSPLDAEALFRRVGLKPADARPITAGWREANAAWKRDRLRRVAEHAERVQDHLRRHGGATRPVQAISRATMGRRRAVWCVELRRSFPTLTDAAAFVQRSPSNILQSLKRGVRCGPFHWEMFDAERHGMNA